MKTDFWTNPYIGIPFKATGRDFSGCDCGGLVLLALRMEKGIIASDFTEYEQTDFRGDPGREKLGVGIECLMSEWIIVDSPQPFDLVRFHVGKHPSHVGIWAGHQNYFLHVEEWGRYARLTPINDRQWGRRFFEFRRHKDLTRVPL